jgi:hypothetical protein
MALPPLLRIGWMVKSLAQDQLGVCNLPPKKEKEKKEVLTATAIISSLV